MKKLIALRWLLVPFLALSFFSCENEPLEGEFVVQDETEGKLVANVDGQRFESVAATAVFSNSALIISGSSADGSTITLNFSLVGECTYDLSSTQSFAAYLTDLNSQNVYVSLGSSGGSGSAIISSIDLNSQKISGTFSFTGVQESDDGNGGVITSTVEITEGEFESISLEVPNDDLEILSCEEINNGGGGDPMMEDPESSFFALVDGVEFEDTEFTSEILTVGDGTVVKLTATNDVGARFDFYIPSNLGIGTFAMESIFDGEVLVGSYNPGTGGEPLTSNPGTITFTEFGMTTGKLQATFSFTGTDPLGSDPTVVQITEGSFNIDFIPDSGTVENTFIATVNGEDYVPTSISMEKEPIGGETVLHLTTINADLNESVSLSFPVNIEAGTYTMAPFVDDGTEKVGIYNPDIGNSILFKSDETGTLVIISHQFSNGVVEGSFNFTANDPLGNFPAEYVISGSFMITIE